MKDEHAKKRLEWALSHRDWSIEQWRQIIWSDECSVELGKGKRQKWCFRLKQLGEKWKKDYIIPYSKSKGISIMIWAAIWGDNHSEIDRMVRDSKAKKNGYSAASYLKILEENLYSIWSPGLEYMHDNAPIHLSKLVKQWFEDNGISIIECPPYSPDLNPIEHAWPRMKELIYTLDPDIETLKARKKILKLTFLSLLSVRGRR